MNSKQHKKQNKTQKNRSRRSKQPFAMLKQISRTSFPAHMNISFHYSETISVTNTGSLANDYQFNLNSLYDPNRTGTGHQPLGYDTWATFYNKYRVDSTEVNIQPLSTTSTTAITSIIVPSNSGSTMTQMFQAHEHPFSKNATFQNNGQRAVLKAHYNMFQVTGVSLEKYLSDDLFTSALSASPSETLILHLVTEDAAQSTPTTYYKVDLIYNSVLFDPNDQVLS
jgi:hypothetical protein